MGHQKLGGREAALIALLSNRYISDVLAELDLDDQERALAREIASGTMRMQLALDYFIGKTAIRKVKLNKFEFALLRSAVYQLAYLERIPSYAVIDEALKMADTPRKGFIHAILSALARQIPPLPEGLSAKAMHTRLSYPLWFVKRLISVYGQHKAEMILEQQNRRVPLMARCVGKVPFCWQEPAAGCYIQNITPGLLLEEACEGLNPKRILDLCASPGGKLLAAHDLFPSAELYANDVSEKKLDRLRENLATYNVEATLTCGRGEDYTSSHPFDLVIVDAPCSNSGVLYKRPEARWRLSQANLKPLIRMQRALLANARRLAPTVIYMTCSILPEEEVEGGAFQKRILPDEEGHEGGYVARFN